MNNLPLAVACVCFAYLCVIKGVGGVKQMSFVNRTEASVFELLIKGVKINTVNSANAQGVEICLFKVMSTTACVDVCGKKRDVVICRQKVLVEE